ncbi:sensor histidine kinase [Pedobacter sp.]|uniref:sensor histidine kinase n=1 Tax=Pedobacter sp. TaxID=1411316 RepID=UPI003D7FAFC3
MKTIVKTLLICILIGFAFGLYLFFNYDNRPQRIFISVLSSVSIGSLMMLVINYRYYFIGITNFQSLKTVIMMVLLVAAALLGSELTFLLQAMILPGQHYQLFNGGSIYVLNCLIVLVTGIPIYVSEEWKNILESRISSQQYRVLQLEQQQTLIELELLRAKVNPHFLYNVHNTIAGLISKDPQKAEEMVILLSKFFRFTLNKNSATFHPLSEELAIVKTYLELQQIRYQKRMRYSIMADQEILNLQVPSFVLQPLVENAVIHGIEKTMASGLIKVGITVDEQHLIMTISDTGPPFLMEAGSGNGLQMVMNKLTLLYETRYTIEFNNSSEKHVRITLPR